MLNNDFDFLIFIEKLSGLFFMFINSRYIYLKRKEIHSSIKSKVLSCLYGVNTIDKFDKKKYKKSDTLFILGSGSSINTFSSENWKLISENDSIGLNFWIIHDFIPTFYCYEEPSSSGGRKKIFYDIMNKKKDLIRDTPIIVKDLLSSSVSFASIPKELKKNIYLSCDFDVPVKGDDLVLKDYLLLLKKLGRLRCSEKIGHIYSITASLSYVAFFALLMGYKRVVFCGVDLCNSLYFYEEMCDYYNDKGIIVPKSMQSPGLHSTDIRSSKKIPISDVLKMMYDLIFIDAGVEFYVAKNIGVLSSYYKVFF